MEFADAFEICQDPAEFQRVLLNAEQDPVLELAIVAAIDGSPQPLQTASDRK